MALIKSVKGIGKSHTALKSLVDYVGLKAELVTGINCSNNIDTIAAEFKVTKEFYDKTDGRQYKHIIQAFKNDEVTPEQAHKIGVEFCNVFKGYEVLVATHTDRAHIHNHFVLNSVSVETGFKYHESKIDLENLKQLSDKLCLENNLSIIDRREKSLNISTYDINTYKLLEGVRENEKQSDLFILARKIKELAAISPSKENFISNLAKEGYSIEWRTERKHITFTIPEDKLIGHKNKFRLEKINKYFNRDIFTEKGLEIEFGRVRSIEEKTKELRKELSTNKLDREVKLGDNKTIKPRQIDKFIEGGLENELGRVGSITEKTIELVKERGAHTLDRTSTLSEDNFIKPKQIDRGIER